MLKTLTDFLKHSWIQPYMKENKKLFILVLVLGTLTVISAGALMFTSGYLISKSSTQPYNILMVYVPIVLVRAFGIARPVFGYLEKLTSHHFVLKILSKMRVRLYQHLETQSLMLKSRFKTGDLLNILADDIEHLQHFYLKTIFPSLVGVVLYMLIVLSLGFFSIPFALLMCMILFVLTVFVPFLSLVVNKKRQGNMKQVRMKLYEKFTDAVMGLCDWKTSGRQQDFLSLYEQHESEYNQEALQFERFTYWRDFLFQWVIALIVILMIWFVAGQVEEGIFSHLWIAAFILVVFPIMEALIPIPEAVSQIPSYDRSLKRLQKVEEMIEEKEDTDLQALHALRSEREYTLTFKDVHFRYPKEPNWVLKGFNLQINQGERIAILGKSGAGKSTIAKLLLGSISPLKGVVTVNDIPTNRLIREMHQMISVLQQNPYLFDSTVMNNIRLGNIHASDEEVIEAAKKVHLHDYIVSLPEGYDTKVQELGERFSGGERQRIALARILLQRNPIVLLDEPTVGLDSITERKLLDTIFDSLHGKTIIWITHHLLGMEKMDRVIFIENGRVEMAGNHHTLLQTNERYELLYKMDRPIEL